MTEPQEAAAARRHEHEHEHLADLLARFAWDAPLDGPPPDHAREAPDHPPPKR